MTTTILLLHPGEMGAAFGAQLATAGHRVLWIPEGRSDATRRRAQDAGLVPTTNLAEGLSNADVVLSICPPAAAEDVATQVSQIGFAGIYVDANAISPTRVERISTLPGLSNVVDGAIIGPPPRTRGARLYLAGIEQPVSTVENLFKDASLIEVRRAGRQLGQASALKMAFASFQKAARPLAAVAHALAYHHDVSDLLLDEAHTMPGDILAATGYLPSVAARGWRWAPEMHEIADTLDAAGLPTDQATAAATVLQHWDTAKDNGALSLHETLAYLFRE